MPCFRQGCPPKGNREGLLADYLLELTRKFQFGWLKVTFLKEAEAAIRLGVKFWWGLAQVTQFWIYCLLSNCPVVLTAFCEILLILCVVFTGHMVFCLISVIFTGHDFRFNDL